MLLGTLGASLSGNILAGKGINRAGEEIIRAGEEIVRAGYGNKNNKNEFLMPPHALTNFEIPKYYQNQTNFNGVYSRDNYSDEIKDVAYMINLDEFSDIGTHCVDLYVFNNDDVTYFYFFGVEHIPKEIKTFIINKKK